MFHCSATAKAGRMQQAVGTRDTAGNQRKGVKALKKPRYIHMR